MDEPEWLISIVKPAATRQAPLPPAAGRGNRTLNKLMEAYQFTVAQKHWLSLVQESLVKNRSIDEQDFDLTSLLQMRGGAGKAQKVFTGFNALIKDINKAVAS